MAPKGREMPPRSGEAEQVGATGQTYPRAHEGNLLVVEAVHGAGEAGSASGPLSIDAGPGKGVPPWLRQVRGWGWRGGQVQGLAPATSRGWLGAGPPRLPGEPARSCRSGSRAPSS